MGRIIGENIQNALIIKDKKSEGTLTLYYGSETAAERIAFKSSLWEREGDKIRSRRTEALQEWGEKKIIGFKEGDFKYKIDGELKIFSSDPESKNYDPKWKELLRKYAPDVLEALAEHIFEEMIVIGRQEEVFTQKNS
jgi:hypothetical protein